MSSSSESDSPRVIISELGDYTLVTTEEGSGIAYGDGPPILLQNLN